jgi:hypothetical protein
LKSASTKKKKIQLIWEEEDSLDMGNENSVLGIISSLSHLQLVHFLNKTKHFNFEKVNEIEVKVKQDKALFICYENNDLDEINHYRLIKNKGISPLKFKESRLNNTLTDEPKSYGILSKELKQVDYLLVLGIENNESIQTIAELLKEQPFIQAVFEIKTNHWSEKTQKLILL